MVVDSPNVGVAFALVCAAGLSTAVGASVVFFPRLVKLASRRVLASSLGFSAGIMCYVSFVEIFIKSHLAFQDAGQTASTGFAFATLCFFGGVAIMLLIDLVVKMLTTKGDGSHGHDHHHDHHLTEPDVEKPEEAVKEVAVAPTCARCNPDPVGDLEVLQHQADELIAAEDAQLLANDRASAEHGTEEEIAAEAPVKEKEDIEDTAEKKKLAKMGINTAIAIAIHNFPEGLATFVAALNEPRVGAVLAFAVGIHNIPEGLCISLPIYYATGNRKRAFGWALLSGASEPLAALLGWAVLANSFSDRMYAILFGVVAGMMVIISVRELLPTAHRYDPEDTVVTYSFIAGMAVMALSLVLFVI